MEQKEVPNSEREIFVQLGQRLSATSNAEKAAEIITEAADKLLGWDACYVILYDPQAGGKPRPLLAVDVVQGKRTKLTDIAPNRPSPNMLRAISENGFIKAEDASVSSDPAFLFGEEKRRAESGMFVPVCTGQHVIAILSIQRYIRGVYNQESLTMLRALADQCAGSLERIWAQDKVNQLAERRSILYTATRTIASSLNREQLYEAIYNAVKQVMPCDDFVIDSYNLATNEIIILYYMERAGGRVYPPPYYADRGLGGLIVHTGKSQIFNNLEEMTASGIQFVFGREEDYTQSIVAVPLLLYGKVNGMISAQSYQPDSYTEDDLELLEMLAAHAAIALENARLFEDMQEIADKDPLIKPMLNRRKFYDLAEREFERVKRYPEALSVMMLDIDNFKLFNDQFGHKLGDLILEMIAQVLIENVRHVDIVGRHGGEEFIVLCPATDSRRAADVAERIRRQVEASALRDKNYKVQSVATLKGELVPGESLRVTVSIGVAELDETCVSIDSLVERADHAMYLAKEEGRNRVKIWPRGKVTGELKLAK
jgi:diguanylate cyclase (GGDEF)-like protein